MADTTEGDTDVLYLGLLVPALTALIAGLVIHSFIIGVNVSDWWRGRSVTPVDHIVTYLLIARICAQCVITLYFIVVTFFSVSMTIFGRIYGFFIYVEIGLTSLLSIYFYLKISNLHTRLFLYLRRMLLPRTRCLIVASLIFSALTSLMMLVSPTSPVNSTKYKTATDNTFIDCRYIDSIYTFTIGTFFPLLFYFTSSVLLFVSLYHHTTRMKMSSNLSNSFEKYYSVMKLSSVTFMCSTVYFIGHFVCDFYICFDCVNLAWLYIVLDFLPVLHSSYVIYRTAKLRNQMSNVLHNVMDFFFQSKDRVIEENIEVSM